MIGPIRSSDQRSVEESSSTTTIHPYERKRSKRSTQAMTSSLPILWNTLQSGGTLTSSSIQRVGMKLQQFAEDKSVHLPFDQDKIELPSSVRSTFLMVFSPDGEKVASTHGDHKIYISLIRTGKMIQTLEGHPRTPWCLAFHPSLKDVVASGCLAGEVRVWDIRSGACEVWVNSHGSVIASVAFHPLDHVILIATANELHFWDFRQSVPFLSLNTASDKERVRFVKFDARGTKIITGISNISSSHPPPLRTPPSAIPPHYPTFNFTPIVSRSTADSPSSSSTSSVGSLSPPLPNLDSDTRDVPSRSSLMNRVMVMSRHLDGLDEPAPQQSPSRNLSHEFQRSTSIDSGDGDPQPSTSRETSPPPSSSSINPVTEYSISLMSTFRRLNSLCTRLAQLMQEQQTSSRLMEGERDVRSTEASTSLSDLLSRLQQSLQNMSTAALTTAIAQEHIQQVRQRVSEILERLVSVSGYRARLSNLRDQIYEVAERYAAGTVGDTLNGSQGWDLLHCLWLVDMSIHLTRQMQRILAADYRLTQITLSSAQTSSGGSGPSSSRGINSLPFDPPPLVSDESSSSARVRSFHPYNRWLIRSRSSSSSSTDSSFNIPLVRVSGPEDNGSPQEEQPEHLFVREALGRDRPRSPPLPEIQQVLSSSIESSSHPLRILNNNPGNPPPSSSQIRAPRTNPLAHHPPSHLWFNAGTLPWPPGELGHGWLGGGSLSCSLSYRLQCWDFASYDLPNLKETHRNVVASKCRIHNDASVDMNPEGTLLASLVPIENSSSINLCIYSLEPRTFAQCLYLWTFGGHAISVSLSPLSRYVVVGLTSPRSITETYSSADVTIGQVFQLKESTSSEDPSTASQCLQHVRNINVSRGEEDIHFNFSLNSIRWLPHVGGGFVYGTNRGHLVICRPKRSDLDDRNDDLKRPYSSNRSTGTQTTLTASPSRNHSGRSGGSLSIGTQTPGGGGSSTESRMDLNSDSE